MFGNGSGNGLWMAGGVIVVLIAAGVYMSTRDDGVLSEREAASVVVPSAPAVVSGTPLPAQPPIDAPQTAQAEQAPAAVPEPVVDRDSDEATIREEAPVHVAEVARHGVADPVHEGLALLGATEAGRL